MYNVGLRRRTQFAYTVLLGFICGRVMRNTANADCPQVCTRSMMCSRVTSLNYILFISSSHMPLLTSNNLLRFSKGRNEKMNSIISLESLSIVFQHDGTTGINLDNGNCVGGVEKFWKILKFIILN